MRRYETAQLAVLLGAMTLGTACRKIDAGPIPVEVAAQPVVVLQQPVPDAQNVYLAALVEAGSARDPIGREGLAWLTAQSLVNAGAGERSADEVREALYPTGSFFEVVVDREWVSLRLRCHRDHASLCAELFADALTAPRFDEAEVIRLRDEQLQALDSGMIADEERLGLEAMEMALFEGHPYGHPPQGRLGVVPLLDASELADFHRAHYVRRTVFVGVAGGYGSELPAELSRRLEAIPGALPPDLPLREPVSPKHRSLLAIETGSPATGFYLAHPLEVDRSHPDYAALMVGVTALGAHRQSWGRLFRSLRAEHGLNYGDYAYLEPYRERSDSSLPETGVLRRQNRFLVWLRPTSLENGPFALKLAVDELERWVKDGLAQDEFDAVRSYVDRSRPLLAEDPGRRLGYALDAAATGTPNLLTLSTEGLTREAVNEAIARHIHPERLQIVAVTGEARALVEAITGDAPTEWHPSGQEEASGPEGADLTERDALVARKELGIAQEHTWMVEAAGLFR